MFVSSVGLDVNPHPLTAEGAAPRQTMALFVAEGGGGVEVGGAAGGEVAGEEGDGEEEDGDADEGDGVVGADAVEDVGEDLGDGGGSGDADEAADDYGAHGLAQDEI